MRGRVEDKVARVESLGGNKRSSLREDDRATESGKGDEQMREKHRESFCESYYSHSSLGGEKPLGRSRPSKGKLLRSRNSTDLYATRNPAQSFNISIAILHRPV
jgi:hypothetical protein